MDVTNFKSVVELLDTFKDEQSCIEHLEWLRWDGNVVSPFDPTSVVYKCKNNRYRCKNTGKYFNVKTNTLFDNTKIPLRKWFVAIYLVTSHKKGISSLQLSRDIDVTQKTAWFMLHRIRKCFGIENNNDLNNTVELDETYVGGKNKNRHSGKKVDHSQGRSGQDKTPVFGMVQRGGKVVALKCGKADGATLLPIIEQFVEEGSNIYTDELTAYNGLDATKYTHKVVNHGRSEYVKGGEFTNTIEGFWAMLKRMIEGIYHSISSKYLQRYVDEAVYRYNTRKLSGSDCFKNMFAASIGVVDYEMVKQIA